MDRDAVTDVDDVERTGLEWASLSTASDLESVFLREYGRVARLVARVLRDPHQAEDLAVEVFLKASRDGAGELEMAALSRRALRMALDTLRRNRRRERLRSLFSVSLHGQGKVERDYAQRERELRVGAVLERMRGRDAELLVLRAEGFSYAELAGALDLHPASVGTLLSRAQESF